MNTNKMRRHNQTRKKDPFRGWRDLGWIDETQGRTFWTDESQTFSDAMNRDISALAQLARLPAWTIRSNQFPRVTLHTPWTAPRIYPADESHIVRGLD